MVPPVFVMLVGLPGAGKSTFIENMKYDISYTVISSDKIREELFGDRTVQTENAKVFEAAKERVRNELREGHNVVLDATNISKKRRIDFTKNVLGKIPCFKECVAIMVPYEVCLQRNAERDYPVPEEVIKRMYMNWQPPHRSEGWDTVVYALNVDTFDEEKYSLGDPDVGLKWMDYEQENTHHTLSLGRHLWKTVNQLSQDDGIDLTLAALLHDVGKPFTKTFVSRRGEVGTEAHYYQHNNVGAYDAYFYLMKYQKVLQLSNDRMAHILNLIYYHMAPYTTWKQSAKAMERDRALLGNEFFNEVLRLHEADERAH